jgi:hypothetical protein
MIDVAISPTRIRAGTAEELYIRLTNSGPGTCTNIIFTLRLPAGLVRLRGTDRIERSALADGESVSSSIQVKAGKAGRYRLTSPNFSYRDHLGQSCHMTGFTAEITAEPGQEAPLIPRLSVELLTAELPLDQWTILRGRVSNIGEADVSDVEVTLSGQAVTTERGGRSVAGQLAAGASADLEFHVRACEAGPQVPVRLDLTYRGPDGRHRDETTPTLRVGRDRTTTRETMKILFLGANPPDLPRLRIDEEIREIEQEIRLGRERDHIKVETRWAVRGPDISRALLDIEPDFVHFAGHGGGGEESFAAENESGNAILVPVAGLVELFETAGESVRCVIVNACSTQQLARDLSAALPRAYVIGMRQPVGDRSAIRFSVGFYQALASGRPVEQAFRLGRAQMKMAPDSYPDPLAPLLLQSNQVIAGELSKRQSQSHLPWVNPRRSEAEPRLVIQFRGPRDTASARPGRDRASRRCRRAG